jgi:hypothetical protein
MLKFTLSHEINCDVEAFWKIFLDKDFTEAQFRQGLEFPGYDVASQKETETEILRTSVAVPKMDVPGPVLKVLGSSFGYTEEGRFNKAAKRWEWKTIPTTMKDKLRTDGSIRAEPAGEGKCRRIVEIEAEAKVFGVGGMLECAREEPAGKLREERTVYEQVACRQEVTDVRQ